MVDVSSLGPSGFLVLIVIFILFVLALRIVFGIVKNAIFVAIASALFPIVANLSGFSITLNIETIVLFITLGLGLYVAYLAARSIYKILSLAERGVKSVAGKRKDEEKPKKKKKAKKH